MSLATNPEAWSANLGCCIIQKNIPAILSDFLRSKNYSLSQGILQSQFMQYLEIFRHSSP
ncbi:hypothetical protein S1OALGB6SA_309 [Olavius algarvensis spirochete endosymbiont]|nr:hypothetical protein S1OALGB6SA_309 [Olavius algarvensis spirochete endosymbiont]